MLFRKRFRTMWQYKAQFLSMILMIALGIGIFTGFNIEWFTLEKDTDAFFEKTGFADYRIADETGFSEEKLDAVRKISGVDDASRYLSDNATVQNDKDIVAVTVSENINVSGFVVTSGADYDKASADGMWLSDQYAEANNIQLGDSLTLVYGNLIFSGKVRGLIKSGEYLICIPDETALMPDYSSYGYVYISPAFLENVFGMQYYPMIHVQSDLEKQAFIDAADDALGYTALVLSKDETVSYAEAHGEMNEGKTMGGILPVLFLAIAVLTMVTTMHRLTASEKTQIGTLKALGFKDWRITLHYTGYALTIGIIGTVIGTALGYWLGWFIMHPEGSMGTYIDMDDWTLFMPAFCWIVLALMLAFLTLIGWLSVKSMLRGTAADALRPYTPKKVRAMRIESTKLWKGLRFGTKWNLRDTLRHKARSGMTLIGVTGCTLLLVGSFGMNDTMQAFVDRFYGDCYNYTTKLNLSTMLEIMYTMLIMLVTAAVVLGIVVLYNLGVMSYTERYREMATLKVIGFKDRKIGGLLISQNIWLTVIGVILGIPLGVLTLKYLLDALAGEYEMSLYISPLTYLISIALAFGVSLLVGVMVAGKNKHIDMVEALKGTE